MITLIIAATLLANCERGHLYYTDIPRLTRTQVASIATRSADRHGRHLTPDGAKAFVEIAIKESSLSPRCKDPRSSAYGLMGFLKSTWAGTGHKKTDCYFCQIDAAYLYIIKRYGSVKAARDFHRRKGYY